MKINRQTFYGWMSAHFGRLNQGQVDGLNALLDAIEPVTDSSPTVIAWVAYELATAYHETAHTFKPIEEIGKGKGRPYGNVDPETGQTYYGRGFVQLTWRADYEAFSKILGEDLVNHPELALRPNLAYKIMATGMADGSFTGKKLADFIREGHVDFLHARRIINGMDRALLIAGYADKFEDALIHSVEDNGEQAQT